jgi:hypothetical protein
LWAAIAHISQPELTAQSPRIQRDSFVLIVLYP